ncbi:hypothetical protein QBC42DRAFT_319840 [Cladorrhinum samala]|uniref:Clr5 domain-containing protein n=1 Tax=Cladorrhinum samala TaxID=585594 RepID=A0AAV9HW87_9PEZI|nr:hypothetical protein QBC42DRAFT_319840 [Cladorrhinum samala]
MGKQSSFDDHCNVIKQLYLVEGRKLSEVIEIMKERGFERSKASYEKYLRKRGFRKNADGKVLEGQVEKRRAEGKETAVDVNAFKHRGKAWVDRSISRRFTDTWTKVKKRREESASDCLVRAGHSMVIRSPSPTVELAFRKESISLWFQFQDSLRAMGIPTRSAVFAGPLCGTPKFSSTVLDSFIEQTLGPLLGKLKLKLRSDVAAGHDIGIVRTRVITLWAEEAIPSMVPERYHNEHRHIAEVLCSRWQSVLGCPEYLTLQLFRLGNNLLGEPAKSDERIIEFMREVGKLWSGSIKELLSSTDWLVQAVKEKLFVAAVRTVDAEILELVLESGFDGNTVIRGLNKWMSKWDHPAIVVAVAGGNEKRSLSVIKLLITHGATKSSQSLALERALLTGRMSIAGTLMETGSLEVDIGRLCQAIYSRQLGPAFKGYDHLLKMIKILVDAGIGKAQIRSILTAVIGLGSLSTFSLMRCHLVSGANQWAGGSLVAVELTNAEFAEVLRAAPTGGCRSILSEAISAGCTNIVRMIIDARCDMDRRMTISMCMRLLWQPLRMMARRGLEQYVRVTPLGLAIWEGDTEITEYLTAREAVDGAVLNILLRSGGGFSITALGLAAFRGHSSIVDLLLRPLRCPTPNSHASLRKLQVLSPLFLACQQGHVGISLKLLDAGLDVNEGDTSARILGEYRCWCRCPGTVNKPLDSLISVLICRFRETDEAHRDLLNRLVRQGAHFDQGLLEAAIAHQRPALFALLSGHCYNTSTQKTPSEIAIECGPVKLVEKLFAIHGLAGIGQINHICHLETAKFLDRIGLLPGLLASNGIQILTSVILSAPMVTQYLLRYEIDLNGSCSPVRCRKAKFETDESLTFSAPLDAAVFMGQLDLVRDFLERGAIITADTWAILTAGTWGCVCDKQERAADILEVLLRFWLQGEGHVTPKLARSQSGGGILLDVALLGDRRAVELLLKHGPAFDEQCLGVALAVAVFYYNNGLAQLFLDAGASLEEQVPPSLRSGPDDCRGECPLLSAVVYGNKDMVGILMRAGAKVNGITGYKALYEAQGKFDGSKMVDVLLAGEAKPDNCQGSLWGPTPLQRAAYRANYPLVLKLIEHGADVNAPPYHSRRRKMVKEGSNGTALQFAVIKGHFQMARLFIEKGADVNAPAVGAGGRTALEGAAEHGRLEILHMLLTEEPKADISGPYRIQFLRAVRLAEKEGHMTAARLLRHHGGWSPSDARESVENPKVVHAGCNYEDPGDCPCGAGSTDTEIEESSREGGNFAESEGINDIPPRGSQHREDQDQESDLCQPKRASLDGHQNASLHTQTIAPGVEVEDDSAMTSVANNDPRQGYDEVVLNTGPGHPAWEHAGSMFAECRLPNGNDGFTGLADTNMVDDSGDVPDFDFGEYIDWPDSATED